MVEAVTRTRGGVPGLADASAGSSRAQGRFQRQVTDTLVMEATTRARSASEACSDS